MKKMKKSVAFEGSSPIGVYEDARTRFKHQSLMQDYEELEKETESTKSKLLIMQQKRMTLLAEVRFLRRRYKYLTEKQPMTKPQNRGNYQQPNNETRRTNILKGKKNSKKESVFRYPSTTSTLDLNRSDVNFNANEVTPVFDLNQKARALGPKEFAYQNPRPVLDLNQQDRIQSGKEASKQKNIPFFDLNQISGEEEDLQEHCEPLKGLLRNSNNNNADDQQNDVKLIACRSIENGPSRSGKRKITWQDQVALRV